jgi:hypothetical protein
MENNKAVHAVTAESAKTERPKSLIKKLCEVMAEVGRVKKRGENTFFGYRYALEADLCDAVREKLAVRNIMMIPNVVAYGTEPLTVTNRRGESSQLQVAHVEVEYTICDGDTDETIKYKMVGCGSDAIDKALFKALTGANKYALMKLFQIPTGDDPEKDDAAIERNQKLQAKTAKAQGIEPPDGSMEDALRASIEIAEKKKQQLNAKLFAADKQKSTVGGSKQVTCGSIGQVISKKDKNGKIYHEFMLNGFSYSTWDTELFPLIHKGNEIELVYSTRGAFRNVVSIKPMAKPGSRQLLSDERPPSEPEEEPDGFQATDQDIPF